MSPFEKYMKDNQRKFDLDQIDPKVWQNIETGIKGKKAGIILLRKRLLGVAAAILIGVLCFQWFDDHQSVSFPKHLLANYGFDDSNVVELLDSKIDVIRQARIPVAYKSQLEMLLEQVNNLDQHFSKKVSILKLAPTEIELNKEILEYYKAKSEILDRVLYEVQKINKNEEEYEIKSQKTSIRL